MKSDGVYGLYRGFGISVVGIIAYRACYFGMFDTGKSLIFGNSKTTNILVMWAFAQTVTVTAGLASYPLDTVRRKMMMQSGRTDVLYKNTLDCFVKVYQKGGINAFFKGASANILRGTGGALVLVFYDKLQGWLIA
jgi:solute carrier family 25 (adenine nucleotide translocator) protein 4/5/6/31